jgi:hypothetical protein
MYSPRKRYRYDGAPTSIPYRGQKRWHMVLGLVFGMATVTWAFSGLLSMEPFQLRRDGPAIESTSGVVRIPQAFRSRLAFAAFADKDPREALAQVAGVQVKELEFTSIVGEPVYLATLTDRASRIIPVEGDPIAELDHEAIIDLVRRDARVRPVHHPDARGEPDEKQETEHNAKPTVHEDERAADHGAPDLILAALGRCGTHRTKKRASSRLGRTTRERRSWFYSSTICRAPSTS